MLNGRNSKLDIPAYVHVARLLPLRTNFQEGMYTETAGRQP